MKVGDFVKFSQSNGIVCYGDVLALATWRDVRHDGTFIAETEVALVRYVWDPDGDPPRRPYRLVSRGRLEVVDKLPDNWVYQEYRDY